MRYRHNARVSDTSRHASETSSRTDTPLSWLIWILSIAATLGIVVGGIFLMPAVTAFVGSFFVDQIAEQVERVHYPADPLGKAVPLMPATMHGTKTALLAIGVYILALPFLFIAGAGLFILFFAAAYLLSREYFEMTSLRHMPHKEAARLRQEHARTIYLAGLLPALMALVPFANLLVPMFATSYFTHIFKSLARGSSAGRGTGRE